MTKSFMPSATRATARASNADTERFFYVPSPGRRHRRQSPLRPQGPQSRHRLFHSTTHPKTPLQEQTILAAQSLGDTRLTWPSWPSMHLVVPVIQNRRNRRRDRNRCQRIFYHRIKKTVNLWIVVFSTLSIAITWKIVQ